MKPVLPTPACSRLPVVTTILVSAVVMALAGCSGNSPRADDGPLYQGSQARDDLSVPPNLLGGNIDPAFRVPEAPGERVSARAVGAGSEQASGGAAATSRSNVLPTSDEIRLQGDGRARWLAVQRSPEDLWEPLRDFWRAERLPLVTDDARNGVMVTQWAENRAGIPLSGSQGILARALGTLYDADTRDQYRMRLERNDSGGTNIYVAHRGAEQRQQSGSEFRWVIGDSDPELEAVMLNRIASFLMTGESSPGDPLRVVEDFEASGEVDLVERSGRLALVLRGNADNLWRRLGLALDRTGLVVDSQNRQAGFYEVTYRPDIVTQDNEPGFFGRIFGGGREDARENERYRIGFIEDGNELLVVADGIEGESIRERDARFVLERLQPELR